MKLDIQAGSLSQSVNIFIRDSSSTTGGGLTGLAFNTAGLTAYYALPRAAAVAISLVTLAAVTSAYSSGGFKEIDATNMPGWYRLDIPDAAIASGRFVSIHLKGAANMAPCPVEIELTAWNNQDVTSLFTTAIAESYAADGSNMTVAQALYLILANVAEFSISGTTLTCKKLDGSTTAATYTLNDATNPTSRTRAT